MSHTLRSTSSRFVLLATFCSVLMVGGCSRSSYPITVDEQVEVLGEDFKSIFADQEPVAHAISLHEAMARGILYNLDHRVSVMEGMIAKGEVDLALLEVLPSLNAQAKYTGRDEDVSYMPRSLATGNPSLPNSVFDEKSKTTARLGVNWNAIDAGIAYAEAKSLSDKARVAEERRRKVVHNIIQDVRYAYWRAASAQILLERIDALIESGKAEVAMLDREVNKWQTPYTKMPRYKQQVRLLENMQELVSLKESLVTAKVELASLINLSPNDNIQLNVDESLIFNQDSIPSLDLDPAAMELVALMIRPEIRENILMKRIGARNVNTTALSAIPGIGAALGYHYDGNNYLGNNDWNEVSFSITQNLVKLFSLPGRMKHVKNKEKLIEMRRRALLVAVMSQVHLSRHRLDLAQDNFRVHHKLAAVTQKISSATEKMKSMSKADHLEHEMDALLNRAKLHLSYAEYQNAYGRVLTSIGMDPLPKDMPVTDLVSMTGIIAKRADKISPKIFDKLLMLVKERGLDALSRQSGHVVMASASEDDVASVTQIAPAAGVPIVQKATPKPSTVSSYND
ncbi:MAG: TolC family protein [Alphaproteobacteria bacterium]|nr:TolC family protein [Alphaproteobacteria bacterium]